MQCDSSVLVQPGLDFGVFVGGVVVADDAQPHPGVCLGDEFEEGQELDMGVARVAGVGGDLAGGDFQCGEQAGGAVADVVVGLLFGDALAQRQNRLGTIQRLDLGLRAPRGAALPNGGERTPSLVCRSRPGKLRAARPGRRWGGWEQP